MIEQLLVYLTPPAHDPQSKEPPLQLYGIFNAEKYKNLWVKFECEWNIKHASLFEDDDLAVSMNTVAPYLAYMPSTHPRIATLLKHYGHGGTLFFWSRENFNQVLEKMRSLFEIRSQEGDKGYLAFYRPDHFTTLMKHDSPLHQRLFTNVDTYFCEDRLDAQKLYLYRMSDHHIIRETITLKGDHP